MWIRYCIGPRNTYAVTRIDTVTGGDVLSDFNDEVVYIFNSAQGEWVITISIHYPACACAARGLSVCLSVCLSVSTKIARSRDLGTWVTCKHNKFVKIIEKLALLCFESFGKVHKHCKTSFLCDVVIKFYQLKSVPPAMTKSFSEGALRIFIDCWWDQSMKEVKNSLLGLLLCLCK